VRVTVHFEDDGNDGRPCGTVYTTDGSPAGVFDGWLELLRTLELIAYTNGQLAAAAEEAAS
jgi:hypothetical protein